MRHRLTLPLVVALFLAACGGGGATTTTAAPTTTTGAPATTATTAAAATTQPRAQGDATLEFPTEVVGGLEFDVSWTGPDNDGDYVTIVEQGALEGAFKDYFYTTDGPSGALLAPVDAGAYEVRYVDGASNATVAFAPITVTAGEATLEAAREVEGGTSIDVTWSRPTDPGPGDYITIVEEGAPEGSFNLYFYTDAGPTETLQVVATAGDYEIRYVNGSEGRTVAALPLTVTPSSATVEAPDEVNAGDEFSVTWAGPDLDRDYITIVPAGSAPGTYRDYAYLTEGNPVTITAPNEAGDYEVWYASDRVAGVFATTPIVVK